jgi:beta-phosphoglucomutase-like phosphatase (HAD superfamily)
VLRALFWKLMIRTRRAFDPRSIKLVIFDLDGTLIDSRLDLVHSVNAALRHIERPELPDDVIASYVGDGAPILIQRALGTEAADEALVRRGLEFFLSYYREHKLDHTTVYPGIPEALAAIRGSANGFRRKLAVLTNKPVNPSRAIVEALGLGQFFAQVYGGNSRKARANYWMRVAQSRSRLRSWGTLTLTCALGAMRGCGPLASPTDLLRIRWRTNRQTCWWTVQKK